MAININNNGNDTYLNSEQPKSQIQIGLLERIFDERKRQSLDKYEDNLPFKSSCSLQYNSIENLIFKDNTLSLENSKNLNIKNPNTKNMKNVLENQHSLLDDKNLTFSFEYKNILLDIEETKVNDIEKLKKAKKTTTLRQNFEVFKF